MAPTVESFGLEQAVLYVEGFPPVPWNGLTGLTLSPAKGEKRAYYLDGVKYVEEVLTEELEGSIEGLSAPKEFAECDGTVAKRLGVYAHQQDRRSFGLSFRSGTKIHILYNVLASPSQRVYISEQETPETMTLSWSLTTQSVPMSGLLPTAHISVDTATAPPSVVSGLIDILYGDEQYSGRLPRPDDVLRLFSSVNLVVIDLGSGLYSLSGPDDTVIRNTPERYTISAPTVVDLGDGKYRISSE